MRNGYDNSPSISDLILATLASGRNVRAFRSILYERKMKRLKKESISVSLSRLHRKNYIRRSSSGWLITKKGEECAKKNQFGGYFPSPFSEKSPINTILSFDIPEKNRKVRNWLRNQIKIFGYKMLQQSLWIGSGPLPLPFMKRLENLNIRKNVKTFRINTNKK